MSLNCVKYQQNILGIISHKLLVLDDVMQCFSFAPSFYGFLVLNI
jgi:hypothetical protein